MAKIITIWEAISHIKDGATIMVGGFAGCGTPHKLVEALSKSEVKNLTLICNDGGKPIGPDGQAFYGLAKLIHRRQIRKIIASHIGLNPEIATQMHENTLEVSLVPQGSLAEMIRAGGAGLGGVLTPTGVGTLVEESEFVHSIVPINGKSYMLHYPLKADIALIAASKVDKMGNAWYKGNSRNFNPLMATAADIVIVEGEEIVECKTLVPEDIVTSSIFIDYIVSGGENNG
jgi:3-oxoacid CoA-transferase, A subunit